jgi:hypothetical protein
MRGNRASHPRSVVRKRRQACRWTNKLTSKVCWWKPESDDKPFDGQRKLIRTIDVALLTIAAFVAVIAILVWLL